MGRKAVMHVNGPHPGPETLAKMEENDGVAAAGETDPKFSPGGQVGLQ
jgi:hypothetical protein